MPQQLDQWKGLLMQCMEENLNLSPIRRDTISAGSRAAISGHSRSSALTAAWEPKASSLCMLLADRAADDIPCSPFQVQVGVHFGQHSLCNRHSYTMLYVNVA